MANKDPVYRRYNTLGFFISLAAIGYIILNLQPSSSQFSSPLISISKLIILTSLQFFLLAIVHNPLRIGQRIYALLNITLISAGVAVTSYHLWIQSSLAGKPKTGDEFTQCHQPIEELFASQPNLLGKLSELVHASTFCPVRSMEQMTIGSAEQCLTLFLILMLISWKNLTRKQKIKGSFL